MLGRPLSLTELLERLRKILFRIVIEEPNPLLANNAILIGIIAQNQFGICKDLIAQEMQRDKQFRLFRIISQD